MKHLPFPATLRTRLRCGIALGLSLLTVGRLCAADISDLAESHADDLRLCTYVTAHTVQRLADDESALGESIGVLRSLGISKVYLEVYRSGLVVTRERLERVRDFLVGKGYPVAGGIATVPGGDFGVAANAGLTWFNWQNPKTQEDLKQVVSMAAGVFDEFIVDDFLCTGDLSAESDAARGERSWSQYRRDLLTRLASEIFIEPARTVNPDIHMVIKYPQWYDRFHLFGYDVARQSPLFDQVWVGTETRGARTQRFGFTQPYEGFVNYRWLADVAGERRGGAWFDHGDCDGPDFVEQAWQTVLAGAGDIVFFNYSNLASGHPGHELIRRDFEALARLAKSIRSHPVVGTAAYKPVNSDAGSDLYLMDALGMLGIPLVPTARFPEDSPVVFLPTQAAADPDIHQHLTASIQRGQHLVLTTGFLAALAEVPRLSRLAGLAEIPIPSPLAADHVKWRGQSQAVAPALRLHGELKPGAATVLLEAVVDGRDVPFLVQHEVRGCRVAVLNSHTYSQADFDAVGEVLLPPTPLGLLEIPETWAAVTRRVFGGSQGLVMRGPTRVTLQPLQNAGWMIQNYNSEPVRVELQARGQLAEFRDMLTDRKWAAKDNRIELELPARSRVWLEAVR